MKNILGIIVIVAALIILLPIVFTLTFSLLAIVLKFLVFVALVAAVWYLIRRLRRLL